MATDDTLERPSGDDRHARLQKLLTRVDELIVAAKARVAAHAAQMATIEKNSFRELYAVSQEVHRTLEEGLSLLLHRRDVLVRELAYVERRTLPWSPHFKLGKADRTAPHKWC